MVVRKDELVKSLFGLYRPDSGVVSLDGQVILDVGVLLTSFHVLVPQSSWGLDMLRKNRKGSDFCGDGRIGQCPWRILSPEQVWLA